MSTATVPGAIRWSGKRFVTAVTVIMVIGAGLSVQDAEASHAVAAEPWMNAALSPDERAALLLPEMTLEERVDLMTGDQGEAPSAFYNGPIPRLGIPELRMADAGGGVADRGWSLPGMGATATAFPAGVNLGATWNPGLAGLYGAQVAVEARATGHAMLLGPGSDMGRTPFSGRVAEGMSEDPELTSAMSTSFVSAVQAKGVIANLKHYAGYTQETNRGIGQNSIIDERTLREVYTLPYANAIEKAGLSSVMCSFNKINGVYACESDLVLDQILRNELGFEGFVITDFGASHSTVPSIEAGMDMETGLEIFYDGALLGAVESGQVSVELVDRAVLRILRTMFAIGVFDNDYTPTAISVSAGGGVAGGVQDESVTLLKNRGSTLPLTRHVDSIAVIGGDANVTARQGGSFAVRPPYEVSLLDAMQNRAGERGASVTYAQGNDPVNAASMIETADMTAIPSSVLTPASGTGVGLTAQHYGNTTFAGSPTTRVEGQVLYDVGFTGGSPAFEALYASQVPAVPNLTPNPVGAGQSAVWTGTLTAPASGEYRLGLTGWGDGRLFIDGVEIVDMTGQDGRRALDATLSLTADQTYSIRVEYAATRPLVPLQPGTLVLQWAPPSQALSPDIEAAVAAARDSDVAVVYVRTYETEERDRVSLKLPQSADQLISAVVDANPRTVVVLASGGPVTMPWIGRTRSVLQNYFGGQEEGSSLARVLLGEVNPSGHLPLTYPKSEQALPPGIGNPWATIGDLDVNYSEGVNVGYRGYLAAGTEPLFPFGFGLSYTSFDLSPPHVTGLSSAGRNDTARVKLRVRNTGKRAGAEVVEVYVGNLRGVAGPPRKLAGFAKVSLAPGRSGQVTIDLDRRSFSYWDTSSSRWVTPRGAVKVYIGTSARDTEFVETISVR